MRIPAIDLLKYGNIEHARSYGWGLVQQHRRRQGRGRCVNSLIHELFICAFQPLRMISINDGGILLAVSLPQEDLQRIRSKPVIGIQLQ